MSSKAGKKLTKQEELLLQDFSRNVSTKSSALFYGNAVIVSIIPICKSHLLCLPRQQHHYHHHNHITSHGENGSRPPRPLCPRNNIEIHRPKVEYTHSAEKVRDTISLNVRFTDSTL